MRPSTSWPSSVSTSITPTSDFPQSRQIRASGHFVHHCVMVAASVVEQVRHFT